MRFYGLQWHEGGRQPPEIALQRTLKPHASPVTVLAIDRTSSLLATGGADAAIKIWDIRLGYVTHTFRGHSGIISALYFFDAIDNLSQEIAKGNRTSSANPVSSDSRNGENREQELNFCLASGSEDGKIRIWDLSKRKSIAHLDSHVSVVRGFAFSASLNFLVSASRDRTVVVWEIPTWRPQRVIPVLEELESVSLLISGSIIATGGQKGMIRLWNARTGTEITSTSRIGGDDSAIVSLISNEPSNYILSIHTDQTLRFNSIQDLVKTVRHQSGLENLQVFRQISGTYDEVIDMAFVGRHRAFLALATNSESLRIISVASIDNYPTGSAQNRYFGEDVSNLTGHEDIIICVTVDWSGYWLATGAKDNTVRIWHVDPAKDVFEQYAVCTGHAESVGAVAFPSLLPPTDSKAYKDPHQFPPPFLFSGSQDLTIKHWNIPKTSSVSPRAIYTRKAHDKDVNALAVAPDSRFLASASQDRTVKVWSVEDGEVQGVLRGHKRGVWSVAFAPKDAAPIGGQAGATPVSRGMILTGGGDKTLKIWSLSDYSCLRTFEGHTNSVLKVLWLPPPFSDSSETQQPSRQVHEIASAGGDGLVKIWDAQSGECQTTLDNHTDRIWSLILEPSTRTLVSGGGDSVITFWKDTSSETSAAREQASTQRIEQDQDLLNRIHNREYREAITLALALDHPARLLGLFQAVMDNEDPEPNSLTGVKAVDEVVASLSDDQLLSLLKRVRDWNTNARTCGVAQRVLNVVLRRYSASRIAGLAKKRGGKDVVDALRAYTERHYNRIEDLWGESWIVEFLLGEMGGLLGEVSSEMD